MNLTKTELQAIISALQLMNIRDQNNEERHLGVEYKEIIKKLEDYLYRLS
jgi:hypothetical protein